MDTHRLWQGFHAMKGYNVKSGSIVGNITSFPNKLNALRPCFEQMDGCLTQSTPTAFGMPGLMVTVEEVQSAFLRVHLLYTS